jgi:hypothetical protein
LSLTLLGHAGVTYRRQAFRPLLISTTYSAQHSCPGGAASDRLGPVEGRFPFGPTLRRPVNLHKAERDRFVLILSEGDRGFSEWAPRSWETNS